MADALPTSDVPPDKKFHFIGGALCLDFCNTMGGKRSAIPREKLHSYEDLLVWSQEAGLIDEAQAAALRKKAADDVERSAAVLARAIELREAIFRILTMEGGNMSSPGDLGLLNLELARCMGRMRIGRRQDGTGFSWGWAGEPVELDHALGPIAHCAAKLLASEKGLAHVRQCRGDNCGWLFIDSSKNHSRCWCDMRDCGNRAKARRHRQKHHV